MAGTRMINRIVDFSVKHRFIVFLLVAAACIAGWWSMQRLALDAIPDLSDTQVIIYSRWDRSPDIIEDQVTYPIVSAMLGAPKVKAVRGFSDFGYSYVYVIFEEGTDIYWARSRTLEYLSGVLPGLPQGVKTELGPDATGLGWIFQYALVDTSGKHSLADLRACQDWYLRYHLKAVPGVAEVAPIGGFSKQYQVNVDPNRLQAYGLSIGNVVDAVRSGNIETGGRLIEFGGTEYMVRGRGYATSLADFENILLATSEGGAPIRIKDIGKVELGPDLRRGVADLDGEGEVVSGIVVMRQGQNALDVIERVKAKLQQIAPGLPEGVNVVPVYDRSELILRAIANLKTTLIEVVVTVALVILLFLWHIPSALIPMITIPVTVLLAFIPFQWMGVSANIMSLGGIAIAIGAMVDAAIVVVEQTHKKLEEWELGGRKEDYHAVVVQAVKQVAGPSFFSLLVIAVAFLPILTLEAQEGRLFKPLAYTKNLSMIVAAFLAITLDPALRLTFTHLRNFNFRPRWLCRATNAVVVGTIHAEEKHPISQVLIRIYRPVAEWSLRWKGAVFAVALVLMIGTVPIFFKLGSEFMPALDEGSLLYMPSTMPGISIGEAQQLLQATDRIIKQFPEVERVLGKAGRAETATDPAPLSMLETVIILRPKEQWRSVDTWYSDWAPGWLKAVLRRFSPDHISQEELISLMNEALRLPGLANGWTMPIKGRIDMLTTGIRTPIGLKISGDDLAAIEAIGSKVEALLPAVKGTRSAFAERTGSGYFLDFKWDREQLAFAGLTMEQAQAAVQNAIGGETVTTTVEGRERYAVNVRYMRDFRQDLPALRRVLVTDEKGQKQIPVGQLAEIEVATGPSMIRNEDGLLTGYVYVDLAGRDPRSYIEEANRLIRDKVTLPPGYAVSWSGQYEAMERVQERMQVVVPLTLFLIFLLLYLNTRSLTKTCIVLLAVPFSAIGAVWLLYLLGYNMSIAVWVGLIALLGVDAETGVFMLLYLDIAYEQAKKEGRMSNLADLRTAVLQGAVTRLRPKLMTTATLFLGLVPIMWSIGTGSDVMKRIAAPMIGGVFTSFLLELLIYPAIFELWKWHSEVKKKGGAPGAALHTEIREPSSKNGTRPPDTPRDLRTDQSPENSQCQQDGAKGLAWAKSWLCGSTLIGFREHGLNQGLTKQFDKSVTAWFLTLRWGTIVCQVLLFAAVRFLFATEVPLLVLWLIAFEVASNLLFTWLIREKKTVPLPLFTGAMFLDITLLTALLALTGGAMNPFTFLYLVHIVVGAILLPGVMAWSLAVFAAACYGLFFWPGLSLPSMADHSIGHAVAPSRDFSLHLQGMWVAYVITSFFVIFFVTRIQQALVARRETMARLREEQLKNERLASLASLSAGAAHELATPLSTIAVVAGELYQEMRQGSHEAWLDDLQLIRSQVNSCREILYQMAADAGEPMGESMTTVAIGDLITEVRAALDDQLQKRLVIECTVLEAGITVPRRSVQQILRGLLANAFQASDATVPVTLEVGIDETTAHFKVSDRGQGMDQETMAQAREPFFTTKPVGQGLGLGLYLAETLAERLGGGLEIDSTPGVGTTVHFWIKAR
jgi:Cu(I)/Ag(I) efflux system membrane protein CusA/SilA